MLYIMHTFKNIDSESRLIRIWSIIDVGFTFKTIEITFFYLAIFYLFYAYDFLVSVQAIVNT